MNVNIGNFPSTGVQKNVLMKPTLHGLSGLMMILMFGLSNNLLIIGVMIMKYWILFTHQVMMIVMISLTQHVLTGSMI